jgi:hypothetical protein
MENALERAKRYREAAARYRQMAETEVDDDVHQRLLDLAEQYEDLANGCLRGSTTAVHDRRRPVPPLSRAASAAFVITTSAR